MKPVLNPNREVRLATGDLLIIEEVPPADKGVERVTCSAIKTGHEDIEKDDPGKILATLRTPRLIGPVYGHLKDPLFVHWNQSNDFLWDP